MQNSTALRRCFGTFSEHVLSPYIASLAVLACLVTGSTSVAQVPMPVGVTPPSPGCVRDIERWMREYQARYNYIAERDNLTDKYIDWPPCCPEGRAPYFPPDDYYDSAIASNPDFAMDLVRHLGSVFCGAGGYTPIFGEFLSSAGEGGFDQPVGTSIDDMYPLFGYADFDCQLYANVDWTNHCDALASLSSAISRLRGTRTPIRCMAPRHYQRFGGASIQCGVEGSGAVEFAQAESGHSCGWDDGGSWNGSTCGASGDSVQSGWRGDSQTSDPHELSCPTEFMIWHTAEARPCLDGENEPKGWEWSFSSFARRGWIEIPEAERHPGTPTLFLAGQAFCQGPFTEEHDVDEEYKAPLGIGLSNKFGQYPQELLIGEHGHRTPTFVNGGSGIIPWSPMTLDDPPYGVCDQGDECGVIPPSQPDCSQHTYGSSAYLNCMCGSQDRDLDWAFGWRLTGAFALFEPELDASADDGKECGDDCGTCVPGVPSGHMGSVRVYFPLGRVAEGRSAGYMQIRGLDISERLAAPARLVLNLDEDVVRCFDTNGDLQQISTESVVAVFAELPSGVAGSGYRIDFYHTEHLSLQGDCYEIGQSDDPFTSTAIAYSTTTIVNPDDPQTNIEARDLTLITTGQKSGVIRFRQAGNYWWVSEGGHPATPAGPFARTLQRHTEVVSDLIVETSTAQADTGGPVSRSLRVMQVLEGDIGQTDEKVVLVASQGADGFEIGETVEYYPRSVLEQGPPRIKSITTTHGFWRTFEYDEDGHLSREISQFQDGTINWSDLNSTADANRAVTFARQHLPGNSTAEDSVIVHRYERLLGELIRWDIDATWGTPVTLASLGWPSGEGWSSGGRREVWRVSVDLAHAFDAQDLFDEPMNTPHRVSYSFRDPQAPYRATLSYGSDGRVTQSDRWDGYDSVLQIPIRISRTISGRLSRGDGQNPPQVLPEAGVTRRTSVSTMQGTRLSEVTEEVSDGQNIFEISSSWSDPQENDIDGFGRAVRVRHSDGTIHERFYDCCGLEAEVDRQGVRTYFVRDEFGRVVESYTQVGVDQSSDPVYVGTRHTFDADGRVVVQERIDESGDPWPVVEYTYDLRGRLVESVDALARATTHALAVDGQTGLILSTTTLPDPDGAGGPLASPQIVSATWADGSEAWVAGSGAHPAYVDHGVEAVADFNNQQLAYSVRLLGSMEQETRTYSDSLGRTVLVVYADGSKVRTDYLDGGRRVVTADPDGVRTITMTGVGEGEKPAGAPGSPTVDWDGGWTLSVADADGDGVIDFDGDDRISMSLSKIATRTVNSQPVPVRRSVSVVWTTAGDADAVLVTGVSDTTFDGLMSWSESAGLSSSSFTTIDRPNGLRTTESIDPTGATTVSVSSYGRAWYTERYDPSRDLIDSTVTVYDELGRVSEVRVIVDPNDSTTDRVTEYVYDAVDQVTMIVTADPDGSGGNPCRTVESVYDDLGRVIETVRGPSLGSSHTSYFPTGEVAATWGYETTPVEMFYDDLGRLVELHTFQDYSTRDGQAVTEWVYDADRGWLVQKTYEDAGDGRMGPSYTYTDAGRLETQTWARGVVKTIGYTPFGEVGSITYSDDTPPVALTYDRLGRLETVSDAAGLRTFVRDDWGRVLSETVEEDTNTGAKLLEHVVVENTYSSEGLRLSHTVTGYNQTQFNAVEYGYDDRFRMNAVTKGTMRARYDYDAVLGRLRNTSVEALDGQFQWQEVGLGERTFDRLGRLVGMDWSVNQALSDRTVYDYDAAGRRVKRTLEDGSYWEYGYDDLGQLTVASRLLSEQKVLPGSQFEYEYDDLGNRKKAWMGGEFDPNGLYDASYTADVLNRYTQRDVPGYAEIVGRSESTVVQVNGVTASREGDFYHRQVSVNNANAAAQLDVAVLEVPGDLTERQLFFAGDPEEFEYDDDGNMTLDGIWSYEWDAENRLKAMQMRPEIAEVRLAGTDPWVRLEFEYDWGGRRIAKRYLTATQSQVTHEGGGVYTIAWDRPLRQNFVYDGWHLSASYRTKDDGEYLSVDQSYAWGPDLSDSPGGAGGIGGLAIYQDDLADSDGGTYIGPMFPSYDGNGNVVALYRLAPSSLTVQAAARYDYGPFGEALGLVGKQAHRFPFRWSTKFTDAETGLVYYGYRYYHPSLGRWISRDPIGERDGPNVFQITRGNPAMHVDPFGLYTNEHGEPNCGPCDRSLPGYRFATEYSQSKEDWQRDALLFAGIHPSLWLTFAEGWVHDTFNRTEHHAGSRFVLTRVYRGYANFFYQRPQELLWSGAAALAGVGVLNNLRDLDRIHDGGRDRAVSWATGPLRRSFIRMAKAVYDDMAWQHLAYLNAGLGELRALVDSGDIPEEVFFDGWCRIAYGDVQDGNLTLLKYEQLDVLQPHFSALRRTYGPLLVEEMSRRASSDGVPGTMTFREYDPNGDITKFTQRWGWVQHEVMRQWFMFSDDMRVHIVYANTPR